MITKSALSRLRKEAMFDVVELPYMDFFLHHDDPSFLVNRILEMCHNCVNGPDQKKSTYVGAIRLAAISIMILRGEKRNKTRIRRTLMDAFDFDIKEPAYRFLAAVQVQSYYTVKIMELCTAFNNLPPEQTQRDYQFSLLELIIRVAAIAVLKQ